MIGTKPYAKLKYREVKGRQMAYIDEGEGDAIVFQHGQPASSCVWRNVMPHLEGRCRLIACDLIGKGRSEKLSPSGPDRYRWLFVWNTLSDAVVATQRGQFLTVG